MISRGKRKYLAKKYHVLALLAKFKRILGFQWGMDACSNGRIYSPEARRQAIAEFVAKRKLDWDPLEFTAWPEHGVAMNTTSYLTVQRGKHRQHHVTEAPLITYEMNWDKFAKFTDTEIPPCSVVENADIWNGNTAQSK